MTKKKNTAMIGGFVVGAVTLAIAGILLFGSGRFFKDELNYALFFEGSVKGMNPGAPVLFRGVKIGSVSDIQILPDPEEKDIRVAVIIQIEPDRITHLGKESEEDHRRKIRDLVDLGLRAQKNLQSFVTGQLLVQFDFYPDKPAKLLGLKTEYPELPTIPSMEEDLLKTLQDLPIEETIKAAKDTLVQAESAMAAVESTFRDDSPLIHQLTQAIDQVSSAAYSLRGMADYLERHPEALLRGKGKSGE